jgi:hypothetical protein
VCGGSSWSACRSTPPEAIDAERERVDEARDSERHRRAELADIEARLARLERVPG